MTWNPDTSNSLYPIRKRVEHVDTDASGVVHFSRYPSLIETAILENLDSLHLGLHVLEKENLDLIVSELQIKYLASAYFLDWLKITMQVEYVGAARFRIIGQVFREEENREETLLASGKFLLGVVNKKTGTASTLPIHLRNKLKECIENGSSQ